MVTSTYTYTSISIFDLISIFYSILFYTTLINVVLLYLIKGLAYLNFLLDNSTWKLNLLKVLFLLFNFCLIILSSIIFLYLIDLNILFKSINLIDICTTLSLSILTKIVLLISFTDNFICFSHSHPHLNLNSHLLLSLFSYRLFLILFSLNIILYLYFTCVLFVKFINLYLFYLHVCIKSFHIWAWRFEISRKITNYLKLKIYLLTYFLRHKCTFSSSSYNFARFLERIILIITSKKVIINKFGQLSNRLRLSINHAYAPPFSFYNLIVVTFLILIFIIMWLNNFILSLFSVLLLLLLLVLVLFVIWFIKYFAFLSVYEFLEPLNQFFDNPASLDYVFTTSRIRAYLYFPNQRFTILKYLQLVKYEFLLPLRLTNYGAKKTIYPETIFINRKYFNFVPEQLYTICLNYDDI